jgi:hypothetical protein
MSIASNDEARVEIRQIKREAHAVVIRVDVGQRSGPSVQCLPDSHAYSLCKVTASVRGPNFLNEVPSESGRSGRF